MAECGPRNEPSFDYELGSFDLIEDMAVIKMIFE